MKLRKFFARERSGMAAVEFALLLPIAIILFLGAFETTNVVMCYMKLISAADTASDLVSQQTSVSTANINDYALASQLVMSPFPAGSLGLVFSSVTWNSSGTASVAWQQDVGATAVTSASIISLATSPAILGNANESVIVVEAKYAYTSPFHYVLPLNFNLSQNSFSKPRKISVIPHS
jgi:Flp pilus assembly protein TadG